MSTLKKVIISVAPVGLTDSGHCSPVTPEEVAREVVACAEAGAGMVHLHVRDGSGAPKGNLSEFRRTLDLITQHCNIVIQGSTGGVSELSLEERCVALNDPRVEVATLNMGSVNFGDGVYINTLSDIRYWAARMKVAGILPELEIFEGGMVNNVFVLAEEDYLDPPFVFAFCLGFPGALPATVHNLHFLKSLIPRDACWGLIHHGMQDLSLLAVAVGMGANFIRVGFEDSVFLRPGRIGATNRQLVEQVVDLVRIMGFEVATPQEARKVLGLRQKAQDGPLAEEKR